MNTSRSEELQIGKVAPGRGRPRTLDDTERRRRITDAAYACFVEQGFARTTTADVAARAQVSKRDLYRVMPNKNDLFAAVIRERSQAILDLPRPAGESLPLIEALERIFRLDLDDEAAAERDAMLNLFARESLQFPELSDLVYDTGIIRFRDDLVDWIDEQRRVGRIEIDDSTELAGLFMDVVFGALLPRRRFKQPPDRRLQQRTIRKRLTIVLAGLGADTDAQSQDAARNTISPPLSTQTGD